MVAWGHQGALACAEPPRGLPPEGLERGGALLQAPWAMTAACGGRPRGPGPCDQGTTGRRRAGLGHPALRTPRPTRICRGGAPPSMQELAGGLAARQGTQGGHRGHRHRALAPAQGLERRDDRRSAPGVPLRVACECKTPQTGRLCSHRLAVGLQDHVWRGGTEHLAEPAQGGGAPGGSPGRAARVPQHEGCAPQRGGLRVPQGRFPRPPQVAAGCSD